MRHVILLALFLLMPLTALAGPWPRQSGERVLGLSLTGDVPAVWAEVGWNKSRWITFKAEKLDTDFYRARLALHQGFAWGTWALSLGLGAKLDHQRLEAWANDGGYMASSLGTTYHLNVGRGLQWPIEGWVNADLRHDNSDLLREDHLEVTLGLKMRPDWSLLSQLTLSRQNEGKVYHSLSPSVIWHSPKGLQLELGVTHDFDGPKNSQLKLGTFFTF